VGARIARDVAVIVLVHLAAASAIGLALPHLADLPEAVRAAGGVTTSEVELGKQFNDDGWLIVLGAVAGLVLGLVLQAWRRTHEVVTLAVIAVAALLAALLAAWIAGATGPADPVGVLADAAEGARATMRVEIESRVAYLVWPLAAVVGALVALLAPPSGAQGTKHPLEASDRGPT
jgi:hypothetical protein